MAYFRNDDIFGIVVDEISWNDIPDYVIDNLRYNLLEGNEDWDERDIEISDELNCGFINLSDFPEVHKEVIRELYNEISTDWDNLHPDFEDIWDSFDQWDKWFKATYKKNFKEEFKNEQEEKK